MSPSEPLLSALGLLTGYGVYRGLWRFWRCLGFIGFRGFIGIVGITLNPETISIPTRRLFTSLDFGV